MADYNIYIHSAISSSTGDATKPWWNSNPFISTRKDDDFSSQVLKGIQKTGNTIMNPDGLITQGVSMIAKAVPWIAIAYAIIKIGNQIYETATDYTSMETGDYRAKVDFQNARATVRRFFMPFSSSINAFRNEREYAIQDEKKRESRMLLGDSVINSYSNRGV